MSKRYNIKWTKHDNQELARYVKNFNAKISRLEKKFDKQLLDNTLSSEQRKDIMLNKKALPERVMVSQLKELIDTRQDLKRELNSLQRFTQRGAEEIVTIDNTDNNIRATKWQKKEMSIRAGIINRKRKERLHEIEQVELEDYTGEKLGYTRADFGMGKQDKVALRELTPFTPTMERSDLNKRFNSLRKQSQSTYFDRKDEQLRQNYISGLHASYNPEDIKDVITVIENMSFKEFYKKWQEQGATMEWASPPIPESLYKAYVRALKSQWLPNYKPTPDTA